MQSTTLILSEKRQTKFGQNLIKKYESKKFLKKFSKNYCQKFWTEKKLLDKISQNLHTFLTSHLPYSQAPLQVCLALSPTQMNLRWLKRLGLRTICDFVQIRLRWRHVMGDENFLTITSTIRCCLFWSETRPILKRRFRRVLRYSRPNWTSAGQKD